MLFIWFQGFTLEFGKLAPGVDTSVRAALVAYFQGKKVAIPLTRPRLRVTFFVCADAVLVDFSLPSFVFMILPGLFAVPIFFLFKCCDSKTSDPGTKVEGCITGLKRRGKETVFAYK